MAAVRVTLIFCDGDGCDGVWPSDHEPGTATQARRRVRSMGWSRSADGRDWCEFCTEERRQAVIDARRGSR